MLLFLLQMAEPDDAMAVKLEIDGSAVLLTRAYSSIREHRESFVGWYADVSALDPDRTHSVRLALPKLAAGRFQGKTSTQTSWRRRAPLLLVFRSVFGYCCLCDEDV
ncbi:MAG: hypothetical protein DMG40_25405 [Acidobacteria bacterium]|nr:MAG: hypothetical protein DMG40_25405 [Acidobacteriota bacterium]